MLAQWLPGSWAPVFDPWWCKSPSYGHFGVGALFFLVKPLRQSITWWQCSSCFSSPRKLSLDILPLTQFPSLCCVWNKNTITFPLLHHLSIFKMIFSFENYDFQLLQSIFPLLGCLTCPNLVLQLECFSNELNHGLGLLLMMVLQ